MDFPNIFTSDISDKIITRINQLSTDSKPHWGKMNAAQMFAHCCVSYEMAFENKHSKPGGFARFILKLFVKNMVVGPKPYPKGGRTAPAFLISDQKDFENEKNRLVKYIQLCVEKGENYFDGKESLSFGKLTKNEWNTMFYKHIDHHLKQFGV